MDPAAQEKRRIELAVKREQLQQLREKRAKRVGELSAKADARAGRDPSAEVAPAAAATPAAAAATPEKTDKKPSSKDAAAAAAAAKKAGAKGAGSKTAAAGAAATPTRAGVSKASKHAPVTVDELVLQAVGDIDPEGRSRRKRVVQLGMSTKGEQAHEIPEERKEQYARETQTMTTADDVVKAEAAAAALEEIQKVRAKEEAERAAASAAAGGGEAAVARSALSLAERKELMGTDEFLGFFTKASNWMSRALAEQYDIMVDYSMDYSGDKSKASTAEAVTFRQRFASERWSRNRCVMAVDYSEQFPELFLCALNANEGDALEVGGACLVWSERSDDAPEFIFHCESPVTTAQFSPFNGQLVVAGTYSGQIVVWDMRVQKRTPVLRTPLSSEGHTHPVYAASIVGTPNAHNLVSVSTDGRMCTWALDMLAQPQAMVELQHSKKPVSVTSIDFLPGDANGYIAGAEDGSVFNGFRHGTREGLDTQFAGAHFGMITAVSAHRQQSMGTQFSDLFLTASFDWTCRLWSLNTPEPLYVFEDAHEYIYDVQWSPKHPAVFASCDGAGVLDVWDLNSNTEMPVAKRQVSQHACNALAWSKDGTRLAVGDSTGAVHVFDVAKEYSEPRVEDWSRFDATLSELRKR